MTPGCQAEQFDDVERVVAVEGLEVLHDQVVHLAPLEMLDYVVDRDLHVVLDVRVFRLEDGVADPLLFTAEVRTFPRRFPAGLLDRDAALTDDGLQAGRSERPEPLLPRRPLNPDGLAALT